MQTVPGVALYYLGLPDQMIQIRPASTADLDALVAIANTGLPAKRLSLADLEKAIDDDRHMLLSAADAEDDRAVG